MVRTSRADVEHLRDVCSLVNRLLAELTAPEPFPGIDEQAILPQLKEAGNAFAAYLALDDKSMPVGVITLTEAVAAYAGGRYGIISELFVVPELRGAGVGRQLLECARSEAMLRGWKRVDVTAPPGSRWDRAVDFYTQNGFVATGRKLKLLLEPG